MNLFEERGGKKTKHNKFICNYFFLSFYFEIIKQNVFDSDKFWIKILFLINIGLQCSDYSTENSKELTNFIFNLFQMLFLFIYFLETKDSFKVSSVCLIFSSFCYCIFLKNMFS